jgi:integrase
MGLTVKRVQRLSKPGRYSDGHGLHLQITSTRVKSWLFRFQRNGHEHFMGLGPLHAFGLEEARERARRARQLLADGIDPLLQKREERDRRRREELQRNAEDAKRKTFAECAEAFLAKHSDGWKNAKHRQQWANTLRDYANPVLGKLYVSDIDTPHIVKVLERDHLWTTKRETARRVLNRIERVLNFAKASGFRNGDNPASWKGHLKDLMPSNGKSVEHHHAALPYTELPAFMADLRQREGIAPRALEFTILTAGRTGETIGAVWPEIDLKAKVWTVPADRMKAAKEHKVPLGDRALDILKSLPTESDNPYVFIGSKAGVGLSAMGMTMVIKRMQRGDITTHGFRSTFMDWAHDQTAFPKVVIDMALAHAVGDKVEAAYRRGDLFDKRRRLMTEWARFCASKPVATGEDKVVVLSAR